MIINISEAKANLSKLVNLAYQGEEVIIAKNNLPLVELVMHKPQSKIVLGLLADKKLDALDKAVMDSVPELEQDFYDADVFPQ